MKILHYGLQRSGTNFLETILKKKYRVKFLNSNQDRSSPLQKHFRLYDDKEKIPEDQYKNNLKIPDFYTFESLLRVVPDYYLVISKDPYSWLLSYKQWAKKCNWPNVNYHYIEEYNLFYGKWLEFSEQTNRILFVRYIDLLKAPADELNRLESKIGLEKRLLSQLPFSNLVSKVNQSSKFSNSRRDYYLQQKYLEYYSQEELQDINFLLDDKVVSLLGYEKIESN